MKIRKRITTPEKLNENLQATSPVTWIMLGVVILALIGIFVWSFLATITYKVEGRASVKDGVATVVIDENRKDEIHVGQTVTISSETVKITGLDDDGRPVVSFVSLQDGEYACTVITKSIHPIEYLTNRWAKSEVKGSD